MNDELSSLKSAMLGHAVADAMGVPVEFESRETLKKDPVTGYRGYGSHSVPAGTWSDDTSMNLASLDSLSWGLDYGDMLERFCRWKNQAAYTATDEVFDMGISTVEALRRFERGTTPLECGGTGEHDNGNGSLMRIIPAVFYCKYRMTNAALPEKLTVIHNISALTHAHPRSKIACGIYAFVLWALLDTGDKTAIANGLRLAEAFYRNEPEFQQEFPRYKRTFQMADTLPLEETIRSGGYVVDTLEAALWCLLTTENYRDCVLKAVNLGRDTDTVAAVAGGLAGVLYGAEDIPEEWLDGLIRREAIEKLCKQFAESKAS